jgi:hypothetical protein
MYKKNISFYKKNREVLIECQAILDVHKYMIYPINLVVCIKKKY